VLNDLLNFDKIEGGTLHLEVTIIPNRALIESTASEFQLQAKKKIDYVLDLSALADQ
jgi:signal transduction histidine kinase